MKPDHHNKKSLRAVDLVTADHTRHSAKLDIKPGQNVCPRCATDLSAALRSEDESATDCDPDYQMDAQRKVDASFTGIGISLNSQQ